METKKRIRQNSKELSEQANKFIEFDEDVTKKIEEKFKRQEYLIENLKDFEVHDFKKYNDKIEKVQSLQDERGRIIRTILGNIYKGSLIENELSMRHGDIYEYRRQYPIHLDEAKEMILKHIHEVSQKLSKENLDILEFVLNNIEEEKGEVVIGSFDISPVMNFIEKNDRTSQYEIKKVNKVIITKNIWRVEITAKFVNGETDLYIFDNSDLPFKIIAYRYKNSIKEIIDNIDKSIDSRISAINIQIEELKDKGKNLLMLAELSKQGEKE
jgi:hypothetical protein